ncbi:energy-coupling factor ABC transporter permease [Microvirgula aerodenitrificans]|uniref:energy-coupling factor ABC transporter permease n=1 Tax=Microvirgula aerodenitrificans TaxID=57480 RepID=UPI00048A5C71|nr:energy-coupling factor ABC transporter permease [Microvirgula aerodenitrificans]
MNLPADFFSPPILLTAGAGALAVLGLAATRVRWRKLDPVALNAWMGACVVIILFWQLSGGFKPGLSFHLLGSTAFTLLAGPWMAMIGMAIVLLALAAWGTLDWGSLGLIFLICVACPVTITGVALRLAQRFLPANYFIYLFLNAFLIGGASFFASALLLVATLGLAGAYPADELLYDVLPFYFLLSWSEAFTTGLMMSIFVVYKPHWVATFDDRRYLYNKPPL